jgi:hypothetical protein
MTEPVTTEKQALLQTVRACFDPMAASHLPEHALPASGSGFAGIIKT